MKELTQLNAAQAEDYGHWVVQHWLNRALRADCWPFGRYRKEGTRWGGVWSVAILCNQARTYNGGVVEAHAPVVIWSVSAENVWSNYVHLPAAIKTLGEGWLDMNPYTMPLREVARDPDRKINRQLARHGLWKVRGGVNLVYVATWDRKRQMEGE